MLLRRLGGLSTGAQTARLAPPTEVLRVACFTNKFLEQSAHLFHDTGLSLAERRVSAQLVINELHFDFHSSFGLLAVRLGHFLHRTLV